MWNCLLRISFWINAHIYPSVNNHCNFKFVLINPSHFLMKLDRFLIVASLKSANLQWRVWLIDTTCNENLSHTVINPHKRLTVFCHLFKKKWTTQTTQSSVMSFFCLVYSILLYRSKGFALWKINPLSMTILSNVRWLVNKISTVNCLVVHTSTDFENRQVE